MNWGIESLIRSVVIIVHRKTTCMELLPKLVKKKLFLAIARKPYSNIVV